MKSRGPMEQGQFLLEARVSGCFTDISKTRGHFSRGHFTLLFATRTDGKAWDDVFPKLKLPPFHPSTAQDDVLVNTQLVCVSSVQRLNDKPLLLVATCQDSRLGRTAVAVRLSEMSRSQQCITEKQRNKGGMESS